jgi:hypothetical protein
LNQAFKRSLTLRATGLERLTVVCLEPKRRRTEDGIEILPVKAFLAELGGLLGG